MYFAFRGLFNGFNGFAGEGEGECLALLAALSLLAALEGGGGSGW